MNPILKEILVTDLELDPQMLVPDARLEDVGLDSLALVDLNMQLQEQLNVTIKEDELSSVPTVGALDLLVAKRLDGR